MGLGSLTTPAEMTRAHCEWEDNERPTSNIEHSTSNEGNSRARRSSGCGHPDVRRDVDTSMCLHPELASGFSVLSSMFGVHSQVSSLYDPAEEQRRGRN